MFEWVRQRVLHFARVPHAPEPPLGAPDSVRIFRAGRNYYKLRLARWGLGQFVGLIGLMFSVGFSFWFRDMIITTHNGLEQLAIVTAAPPAVTPPPQPAAATDKPAPKPKRNRKMTSNDFKTLARITPMWAIPVIELLELGAILFYLVQLPVSFAGVRLEFELHWYIVTDRSLRIRTGLVRVQESTMSFANLQQVEVKQGPVQRLLGLSDLRVQSAGGSDGQAERHGGDSLHTGVFHSVENATEIRDLILERLRKFRETGLGDPDDHHRHQDGHAPAAAPSGDALAAAHELLAEARELRAVSNC